MVRQLCVRTRFIDGTNSNQSTRKTNHRGHHTRYKRVEPERLFQHHNSNNNKINYNLNTTTTMNKPFAILLAVAVLTCLAVTLW